METLVHIFEGMGKIGCNSGLSQDYAIYLTQLFQFYESRPRDEPQPKQLTNSIRPDKSLLRCFWFHFLIVIYRILLWHLVTQLCFHITMAKSSEDPWTDMLNEREHPQQRHAICLQYWNLYTSRDSPGGGGDWYDIPPHLA
jgi:hypothetical protein